MSTDRRRRKSQTAIQTAFLNLLEKETFEELTVQKIADTADVSRMTFYAYYVDKLDLLEQMENQSINQIREFISAQHQETDRKATEMIRAIMSYLVHHVGENITFYNVMFRVGNASMLQEKLYQALYHHLANYTDRDGTIGDFPFSYFMSYVSGAGISLIRHWVLDSERISEEALIHHFLTIITEGPASYLEK